MKYLFLLIFLSSCGVRVYRDKDTLYACRVVSFLLHVETYKYKTLEEANNKCEQYGVTKKKKKYKW